MPSDDSLVYNLHPTTELEKNLLLILTILVAQYGDVFNIISGTYSVVKIEPVDYIEMLEKGYILEAYGDSGIAYYRVKL